MRALCLPVLGSYFFLATLMPGMTTTSSMPSVGSSAHYASSPDGQSNQNSLFRHGGGDHVPGGVGGGGRSSSHLLQRVERDDSSFIITPPTIVKPKVCAKGDAICIPSNYSKFDLPNETLTVVNVGIDIKDIPKIDDKEFSITLNAFFVVRWTDRRMSIDQEKLHSLFKKGLVCNELI